MPLCFVSIGSNIERESNIRGALQALRAHFGPLLVSAVYETPAVGFDGEPFYNLVAAFAIDAPIERIRDRLLHVETSHGRVREPRLAARTLDLDILLYGDLVRHDNAFDIPRGEIAEQAFVLAPLAEIAPDLRHPQSGEPYRDSWERLRPATSPFPEIVRLVY